MPNQEILQGASDDLDSAAGRTSSPLEEHDTNQLPASSQQQENRPERGPLIQEQHNVRKGTTSKMHQQKPQMKEIILSCSEDDKEA